MSRNTNPPTEYAWRPLPGSQSLAIASTCDEILYHGTRGPGKSEAQLAYFVARCGRGYGTHWNGVILDRGYKNLGDLIAKSQVMIPKIFPKAKFFSSKSDLLWKFPDGETLMFRHAKRIDDYRNFHGQEFPYIGWNELTSFPTSDLYDAMKSCSRSGFLPKEHSPKLTAEDKRVIVECELLGEPIPNDIQEKIIPDIPLVTFSTTNPHGVGHNWIKRRFIDASPPGVPVIKTVNVYNPRTKKEEPVSTSLVHIFGSYRENKYLDAKYVASLNAITDPAKRAAWLGGNWAITSGGALDDIWNSSVHVVPRFVVPKEWRITRSFDWGSSHPFSVGFWAIANGEEVELHNGRKFCPPRGSLVRIAEIYGCEKFRNEMGVWDYAYGTNRGTKLSAREIARQIIEMQDELTDDGWISTRVYPGPADNQISNVNEAESNSVAQIMEREGIYWEKSDKKAGSRVNGLETMRSALENAVQGEGPGLYVMNNCEAFIETVPSIARDEVKQDDVDTTSEDHIYDEARYMVTFDKAVFAGNVSIDMIS